MLVEEAGQVLEAHILGSLVPSIQHMIMIGDPLQLRPTINTYGAWRFTAWLITIFIYVQRPFYGSQAGQEDIQIRYVSHGTAVVFGACNVADRCSTSNASRGLESYPVCCGVILWLIIFTKNYTGIPYTPNSGITTWSRIIRLFAV